ncbi:MAG: tetratricopeptide repeat protein [bacterium]|nr:tetratricopeptide repeat protein [bacterium]
MSLQISSAVVFSWIAGLAGLRRDTERRDEAVAEARRAVALAPDQPEARLTLGEILRREGRFAEAIPELRRGLGLVPYHPEMNITLARALAAHGDHAAAVEHFRQAVHYLHNVPEWYLDYADALLHLRRYREAVAVLEQGAERTASAGVINELAWLLATCPDPLVRNVETATLQVRHLIDVTVEPNARFLQTLAAAHAAAGDFQSAGRIAGQAIELARTAAQEQLVDALEWQRRSYERSIPWTDPIRPPGSKVGSGTP